MANAAQLRVSGVLIKQLLKLPEGWRVLRIVPPQSAEYDDAIILVVEGDGLPPVAEGQILPEVRGTYTKHADGSVTVKFAATGAAA